MSSDLITIERPGPPAVVRELAPLVEAARALVVVDAESHGTALERARALRNGERALTDYFEPARKAADQAKKEILAARDGLLAPIAEARRIYERSAGGYEVEAKRRADEEARRLAQEARRQEEDRTLMAAVEAEEAGDVEEAAAILEAPVTVPVVTVAPAVAVVEQVSAREVWSAEVTDAEALVRYVAAHPEWLSLLEVERLAELHPNLNRLAAAQREALSIPGVRAVSRSVRSYRQ